MGSLIAIDCHSISIRVTFYERLIIYVAAPSWQLISNILTISGFYIISFDAISTREGSEEVVCLAQSDDKVRGIEECHSTLSGGALVHRHHGEEQAFHHK